MTDLGTSQRRGADDGSAPEDARGGAGGGASGCGRRGISWDGAPLKARVRAVAAGLTPAALWRNHRLFTIAACVSVIPRVIATLGFKPALLIQDSFSYMKQSVQLLPLAELRPAGYPLVLHLLEPFHSLLLVTTLQHLMGIALAAVIYAVLRTRGLPAWGATLAAVPTLFDSRQIWLESSILPDTLFTLVLMIAVAILRRPAEAGHLAGGHRRAAGLLGLGHPRQRRPRHRDHPGLPAGHARRLEGPGGLPGGVRGPAGRPTR